MSKEDGTACRGGAGWGIIEEGNGDGEAVGYIYAGQEEEGGGGASAASAWGAEKEECGKKVTFAVKKWNRPVQRRTKPTLKWKITNQKENQ